MKLKDLPYGKWFGVEDGIYGDYVYLKTNLGIAISTGANSAYNYKYGLISLRHYHGVRTNLVFDFDPDTEVVEVDVKFEFSLNNTENQVKLYNLDNIHSLDVVSVTIPNQEKNMLLYCLYKEEGNIIVVEAETGLIVDNSFLNYMLHIGTPWRNNNINLIARIDNYSVAAANSFNK